MTIRELLEQLGMEVLAVHCEKEQTYYDVCLYEKDCELYSNILYISEEPADAEGITFLYPEGVTGTKAKQSWYVIKGDLMQCFKRLHNYFMKQNQNVFQVQPFISYFVSRTDHDIQGIVDHFAETMGNPIILTNSVYKVVAINSMGLTHFDPVFDAAMETGYCSSEAIRSFESEGVTERVLRTNSVFLLSEGLAQQVPRILGRVDVKGETVAYLGILEGVKKFEQQDLHTAEMLCEILRQEFDRDETLLHRTNIIYESLLLDILEGSLSNEMVLRDRLEASHWKTGRYFRCSMITTKINGTPISNLSFLLNTIRRTLNIKVIRYEEELLVVNNYRNPEEYRRQRDYIEKYVGMFGLKCGISGEFEDLLELPRAYREASSTLHLASVLKAKDTCFDGSALLPFFLIAGTNRKTLMELRNLHYRRLCDYDTKNATELADTLYYYVLCSCSMNETAERLHIHRNTLRYRLEKIEEVAGVDLSYGIDLQNYVLYHQIQRYLKAIESSKER